MKADFEQVIDWTKVKKDTKVLVSIDGEQWNKRYFAHYRKNTFYCYSNGTTSWNYKEIACSISPWEYCKLAEEE